MSKRANEHAKINIHYQNIDQLKLMLANKQYGTHKSLSVSENSRFCVILHPHSKASV